jgi:hypothetical protein
MHQRMQNTVASRMVTIRMNITAFAQASLAAAGSGSKVGG